jgi:hypothetical protein
LSIYWFSINKRFPSKEGNMEKTEVVLTEVQEALNNKSKKPILKKQTNMPRDVVVKSVSVDEAGDPLKLTEAAEVNDIPISIEKINIIYALHTFVATLEGQISVLKGDSLLLLDDSNSYWWLVRCLKTDEIGFIPAENTEV